MSRLAAGFRYPPTPDVAGRVRERLAAEGSPRWTAARRWALAAAALFLMLGGLLSAPQARAGLIRLIQIGRVAILAGEPTAALTATPLPQSPRAATPAAPTLTVTPTPGDLPAYLDLAGETTLAEARTAASFPIRLPAYPPDLGEPDKVYVQDINGALVVLLWLEPQQTQQPQQPRLSLHILGPGVVAMKGEPALVELTEVNGHSAAWTLGPYMLVYRFGNRADSDFRTLVEGHVLIWEEDGLTYRLETDLTLEEAVKIAESLE